MVFIVLMLLLRSLVDPIPPAMTVVVPYLAALGANAWGFDTVFDLPALDVSVPLLSFLFLVALGMDFNIFPAEPSGGTL